MYYVAYGSNLNKEQMGYRCPSAQPIGTAIMKDYRLMYKGSMTGAYLTIEPASGCEVPVGIWHVNQADRDALDRYEGYPTFYYRKGLKLACSDGKTHDCFIYIMHENRPIGIPADYYVLTCEQGYKDFGFDPKILEDAYVYSINTWYAQKRGGEANMICGYCGKEFAERPALSRKDNHTDICPECGIRESLDIFGCTEEEKEHIITVIRAAEMRSKLHCV